MRIFGEIKVPCEYMSNDNMTQDWLMDCVANKIAKELLNKNLINFTERYECGYYIMDGEVDCESTR